MPRGEELLYPSKRERFEDRRKESQQRKLVDTFFDHATLLTVSRLITEGQFDALDSPISTGKEGGVFRATKGAELRAVKIYRIGNTSYRRLPAYALDDLRRETSARNFTGLIMAWTRREHTILTRLTDAGVRVPRPYAHHRNVLVMEFIGNAEGAAPRLRDVPIDDPHALYEELVRQIGMMLTKTHLVHGDLSPWNMLYFEDRPVMIDVGQAIRSDHPEARRLLLRDLEHFARFLTQLGHEVSTEEFFQAVGGDTLKVPGESG